MSSVDSDSERLAVFFDHSPDAIVVVDSDGEIRRANERVSEMFGYDPADLEGEPVERLVPEGDRDRHPDLRDDYLSDPESRPMGAGLDLRAQHRNGSTFPVDVSLSPIETDGDVEVIAAVRDRTDHERLQQKYRALLETAPDAAFVVDADTREILEANEAAGDLLGVPEDGVVGSDVTRLHPSTDAQRYRDLFDSHPPGEQRTVSRFEDGDPVEVETADGERIPVEISAQHAQLLGRSVVTAMFRDVRERRAYERNLHHQIDRLERLAELLSHDLRNPLNVAEGNLELARETEDWSRLSEVERAHDRMREILEDALVMVRGGTEVESVDPLEVSGVAAECWTNVATADADLVVASNGLVYADETRIGHLFENLFRNAVEHAGDDVVVTVGVTDDGFYVEDDGPGIPEDQRVSVLESGWTTRSSGSGLGLSIVADIAAAHEWEVSVGESETGGARFEFSGVRAAPYDDSYERQPEAQ